MGRIPRLAAATLAVALALATPARAAEDASPPQGTLRIEVTGSHITRTDIETALPVQVITREDVERSGATTVSELMSRISANVSPFNDRLSVGNQIQPAPRPGMSSINLRGLGDGNTLVLINGRRVSNYAFDGSAVDVNAIPLAAIDRVEILKDGASAIYGTDAIAGVVNFILRKDYQGVEVSATGAWTQQGGGDQLRGSITAGYGDLTRDRFNVMGTVQFQKDDALGATQREFSRTGYRQDGLSAVSVQGFPANVQLGSGRIGSPNYASGCAPPDSIAATIDGTSACFYDLNRPTDLIPKTERLQAFARATFQVHPDWQVHAEAGWSRNLFELVWPATPAYRIFLQDFEPLLYPATGPYFPHDFAAANGLAGDLNLRYRTVGLGPRINDVDSQATRVVVGTEGTYRGWDVAAGVLYSDNRQVDSYSSGYVSQRRLIDAMATGLINPFGPSGPEGDALLAGTEVSGDFHSAKGTTWLVDARVSGSPLALPAGPLAIAFGAEWRRESLENQFAAIADSGDVIGIGRNPLSTRSSRNVGALFAEADVPIAKGLDAQLALRHDNYSDFGGTTNPKVALRWQPDKTFLMRASWGEGFRAPTLYDLYTPLRPGLTSPFTPDPLRCPTTGLPADCEGEFPAVAGGNPNLGPETSKQFNAGLVWEPLSGLSMTVDYWNIRKRGVISSLGENDVLSTGSPWLASNVVRGPVDPAWPGLPGPIQSVILWNENIGDVKTSGIDVGLSWRSPMTAIGRFTFTIDGTYIGSYDLSTSDGTRYSLAGNNDLMAIPRWRHFASVGWGYGAWAATLAQTFQSSYSEIDDRFCDEFGCARRHVGAYDVWDAQVRYRATSTTVVLGVKNLFDRTPPFAFWSPTFASGADGSYADPRGRTYYATLTYVFR